MTKLTWTKTKCDGISIYSANDEYNNFEIRSWGYGGVDHDEGTFQLCVDGYHKGNFKTLAESKDAAETFDW